MQLYAARWQTQPPPRPAWRIQSRQEGPYAQTMTPSPPKLAAASSGFEKPRRAWIWITALALTFVVVAGLVVGLYASFTAFIPEPLSADAGFTAQEVAAQELAIARMHTQALRNAFAVTGGLAVLLALAVTIRRQIHHERATAKSQADEQRRQDHLENEAQQRREEERRRQTHIEEDARQRRITDSRVRAVEQLGSDNPAVRIGGLHNLERIGQLHPELRQVIVDELCAYLRRTHTPPAIGSQRTLSKRQFEPLDSPVEVAAVDDEAEVRRTAQEILQRHLAPGNPDQYWQEHTRLNLRGAHLDTVDFSDCHLNQVDFTGATFTNNAFFADATFTGTALFANATFTESADFNSATFTYSADFRHTTFTYFSIFVDATFTNDVFFAEATFSGNSLFANATFTKSADFENATFALDAIFAGTTFTVSTTFNGVTFSSGAVFTNATFSRGGFFRKASFIGEAHFDHATFAYMGFFEKAIFTKIASFRRTTFTGDPRFANATFMNSADFREAIFTSSMDFRETKFASDADFEHTQFPDAPVASSSLLEALQRSRARLRLGSRHELPQPWTLVPDSASPGWGRVEVAPTAA